VRAVLWHELGILLVGAAIVAITWDVPNQVGTGTYLAPWVMAHQRQAQFVLGVRNLSEAFLPSHLAYRQALLRRRADETGFFHRLSLRPALTWPSWSRRPTALTVRHKRWATRCWPPCWPWRWWSTCCWCFRWTPPRCGAGPSASVHRRLPAGAIPAQCHTMWHAGGIFRRHTALARGDNLDAHDSSFQIR